MALLLDEIQRGRALGPQRVVLRLGQRLDGLDLRNDDIRLFALDRDSNGYAQIKRILVSQDLINEGQPLSRLWINGRLGGVPTLL